MVIPVKLSKLQKAFVPIVLIPVGIIVLAHPWINLSSLEMIIAFELSLESNTLLFLSTLIVFKFWHPPKALTPTSVIYSGIVICVNSLLP